MTALYVSEKAEEIFIKDYKTDLNLSAKVRQFLKEINSGGPALETLSIEEAQSILVNMQSSIEVDISGIDVTEKTIIEDDFEIRLTIIRPEGNHKQLPVFLFIHGGGWVLGDFNTHKRMVRDLVVLSEMTCVFINYSRSPEAQYPKAINEIYSTLKWISKHKDEINIDGDNIALVGNSVGGNMAAAISIMAKERNGPKIKFQLLLWPIVDANFETISYRKYGEDRFLTTNAMKWMYDLYLPEVLMRKEIYASPLQATIDELKEMPPTLIITAENDILRDEAEEFGKKLDEAGVEVTTIRYNGMIHDFGLLNGLAALPETRSLFSHATSELKRHLLSDLKSKSI